MPMRRYVFVLEETIDGTNYNHGKIVSTVSQMETRFANEPGHNGDLFDQWVADGRIDIWRFSDSQLPYLKMLPHFPEGWEPVDGAVTSHYEDTDYLACFYYDINGVDGYAGPDPGFTILMVQTDREYPAGYLDPIGNPYDSGVWSA